MADQSKWQCKNYFINYVKGIQACKFELKESINNN